MKREARPILGAAGGAPRQQEQCGETGREVTTKSHRSPPGAENQAIPRVTQWPRYQQETRDRSTPRLEPLPAAHYLSILAVGFCSTRPGLDGPAGSSPGTILGQKVVVRVSRVLAAAAIGVPPSPTSRFYRDAPWPRACLGHGWTMWTRAFPFLLASLWLVGLPQGAWAGDPALSLTSEQKTWALATSALLFQRNMESHELLSGAPSTDWHTEGTRELL